MSRLQHLLKRAVDLADRRERDAAWAQLSATIRRYVRASLGTELRTVEESADIVNSVAASFVREFDAASIEFSSEPKLRAYLRLAVQNKIRDHRRRSWARTALATTDLERVDESKRVTPAPPIQAPCCGAEFDELCGRVRHSLQPHELAVWTLFLEGWRYDEIRSELKLESSDAVRKRISRIQRKLRNVLRPRASDREP